MQNKIHTKLFGQQIFLKTQSDSWKISFLKIQLCYKKGFFHFNKKEGMPILRDKYMIFFIKIWGDDSYNEEITFTKFHEKNQLKSRYF